MKKYIYIISSVSLILLLSLVLYIYVSEQKGNDVNGSVTVLRNSQDGTSVWELNLGKEVLSREISITEAGREYKISSSKGLYLRLSHGLPERDGYVFLLEVEKVPNDVSYSLKPINLLQIELNHEKLSQKSAKKTLFTVESFNQILTDEDRRSRRYSSFVAVKLDSLQKNITVSISHSSKKDELNADTNWIAKEYVFDVNTHQLITSE